MKAWRRAVIDLPCGAEMGCLVRKGMGYLELSGSGWRKVRCAKHAGEPEPKVLLEGPLPAAALTVPSFQHEAHRDDVSPMTGMRHLARTARMGPKMIQFDPKKRQANDE